MHKIWPGRRAHWVKYKNISNSDLDGMSLASFCQSRAELFLSYSAPLCEKWLWKAQYGIFFIIIK